MATSSRNIAMACFISIVGFSSGCSNYDPVAVNECPKVVSHSAALLGKLAPSQTQMMEECKAADDKERGCAMAATKSSELIKC